MVVGAFPAAKLGVLALKQISKPIANIIKNKAKNSQFFRQYICMPPAQFYNWIEVKTKMSVMNLGQPIQVPQLNEAMAIDLGANLLGEVIIFVIGAGVLIFEYVRQSNKETKKEENTVQEKKELQNSLTDLALQLERQDAQIRQMSRVIADLESRHWFAKKFTSNKEPTLQHTNNVYENTSNQEHDPANPDLLLYYGNFDPKKGLIFKALNSIENEIFYSEGSDLKRPSGIITNALVELKYDVYS